MMPKSPKSKEPEIDRRVMDFCPFCFADNDGGSWNHDTVEGFCSNCGVSGATIKIPKWAVDRIRKSASWVGQRYYPTDEDFEEQEERSALLKLVKDFPGRTVRHLQPYEDGRFEVTQERPGGRMTSVTVEADSEADALEKARELLPYVPNPKAPKRARKGRE